MNPDRLAELEEERRFLLASIRDLDRELAAGDVDTADHQALRDGYVARAAAVLREIEDGRSSRQARPHRPWWRRLAVPVLTLAVAVGLGVAVAQFAGQRLPGQTLTGGPEVDRVAALLSEARSVIGTDAVGSLQRFEEVLQLEPENVEALTYSGWLRLVAGGEDATVLAAGLARLREAVEVDPEYADAHCLLAVGLANVVEPPDLEGARAAVDACLALDPPADMVGLVEGLRQRLGD